MQNSKKEFAIERQKKLNETLNSFIETAFQDKAEISKLTDHYRYVNSFYKYSFRNTMLIYAQGGKLCQSYKGWQKFNRQVMKGQKSRILVYVPIMYKDKKTDEIELRGFTLKPTFDISQTEILDPTKPDIDLKYIHNSDIETSYTYDDIKSVMGKLFNIPIIEEVMHETRGYCDYSKIGINQASNNIDRIKTLFHELGHFNIHKDSNSSRAVKEIEAESVSYLVLSYMGIDYDLSAEYVRSWGNKETAEKIDYKSVLKTAENIIKGIPA